MSDIAEWSDCRKMMNGIRPEGCTCIFRRGMRRDGSGQVIEPAEFDQDPECPLHGGGVDA